MTAADWLTLAGLLAMQALALSVAWSSGRAEGRREGDLEARRRYWRARAIIERRR